MADLHGNLVGGAADALGLDLKDRGGVAQGVLEGLERIAKLLE